MCTKRPIHLLHFQARNPFSEDEFLGSNGPLPAIEGLQYRQV